MKDAMPGRLEGKCAVIAGAGQTPGETLGNGRAIARLFAREGARVLCADIDGERAAETAEIIRAEGGDAHALAVDVTRSADIDAMVAEALARLGRIDILVNNVGIGGGGDAAVDLIAEDVFDRIMAVNLKGMLLATRAVAPLMQSQGGGSIVNISSIASDAGGGLVAYELSKAAVNRLTISTAQSQARHNIRCNAIKLGMMDTPMAITAMARITGRPVADIRADRDAAVPLGRKMGTAWDTAHAALFLASDDARFITGAILPVDGGFGIRAS